MSVICFGMRVLQYVLEVAGHLDRCIQDHWHKLQIINIGFTHRVSSSVRPANTKITLEGQSGATDRQANQNQAQTYKTLAEISNQPSRAKHLSAWPSPRQHSNTEPKTNQQNKIIDRATKHTYTQGLSLAPFYWSVVGSVWRVLFELCLPSISGHALQLSSAFVLLLCFWILLLTVRFGPTFAFHD